MPEDVLKIVIVFDVGSLDQSKTSKGNESE